MSNSWTVVASHSTSGNSVIELCAGKFSQYATKLFAEQLSESVNYFVSKVDGAFSVYRSTDSHHQTCSLDEIGLWQCTCLLKQNKGIPCRHIVSVLRQEGNQLFDERYFNIRWAIVLQYEQTNSSFVTTDEKFFDSPEIFPASVNSSCLDDFKEESESANTSTLKSFPDVSKMLPQARYNSLLNSTKEICSLASRQASTTNLLLSVFSFICTEMRGDRFATDESLETIVRALKNNLSRKVETEGVPSHNLEKPLKTAVIPPLKISKTGRPPSKRYRSASEPKSGLNSRSCTFCRGKGHQRDNCPRTLELGMGTRLNSENFYFLSSMKPSGLISMKDIAYKISPLVMICIVIDILANAEFSYVCYTGIGNDTNIVEKATVPFQVFSEWCKKGVDRQHLVYMTKKMETSPSNLEENSKKVKLETPCLPFTKKLTTYSYRWSNDNAISFQPLDPSQQKALELIKNGTSVFVTGAAGSGKSCVLFTALSHLLEKRVAVTASTWLAARPFKGTSLHHFAGFTDLDPWSIPVLEKIKKGVIGARFRTTDTLIIEEISMIDGRYFEKLNALVQTCRENTTPFGGLQVIACGDFFQLPPPTKKPIYAFESPAWNSIFNSENSIELKGGHRFSDASYFEVLARLRVGNLLQQDLNLLQKTCSKDPWGDAATSLFPRKEQVHQFNSNRLLQLTTQMHVFSCIDSSSDPRHVALLNQICNTEENISLKIGASVILVARIAENLVNGSMGIVHSLNDNKLFSC
eukprot:Pompholyxophrys_punicea_v1_NODE_106_length_3448_cov_7.191276.p1 type:complete len:751 gc:universal NODE_106_length_3448_cov_7.191276:2613-361(-)